MPCGVGIGPRSSVRDASSSQGTKAPGRDSCPQTSPQHDASHLSTRLTPANGISPCNKHGARNLRGTICNDATAEHAGIHPGLLRGSRMPKVLSSVTGRRIICARIPIPCARLRTVGLSCRNAVASGLVIGRHPCCRFGHRSSELRGICHGMHHSFLAPDCAESVTQ